MISVYEPYINPCAVDLLVDSIKEGWISASGADVKKFETMFAQYLGCEFAVTVSSGTAALETAMYALGIERGDVVIIPSLTIISCAIAALRLGAVPMIVDVDPRTWCLDPGSLENAIERYGFDGKIKLIMPVHLFGRSAVPEKLLTIAKKYDLLVLEDASQALGSEACSARKVSRMKRSRCLCGTVGDAATFSFFANKTVTTGEGGMITTDDARVAEKARDYRNLFFGNEERFVHREIGYNFRMSNLAAVLGVSQIMIIEDTIEKKMRIAEWYRSFLSGCESIIFQDLPDESVTVPWMNAIVINSEVGMSSVELRRMLRERGIDSRGFFIGLHRQPALLNRASIIIPEDGCPHTDLLSDRGLYLPSGPGLSHEQVEYICNSLIDLLGG